jgi:alpha-1,3/alpha-1,6-mannosyltransferase
MLLPGTRVLFYCHFPDLLLSARQGSWAKALYRLPLDYLEQVCVLVWC